MCTSCSVLSRSVHRLVGRLPRVRAQKAHPFDQPGDREAFEHRAGLRRVAHHRLHVTAHQVAIVIIHGPRQRVQPAPVAIRGERQQRLLVKGGAHQHLHHAVNSGHQLAPRLLRPVFRRRRRKPVVIAPRPRRLAAEIRVEMAHRVIFALLQPDAEMLQVRARQLTGVIDEGQRRVRRARGERVHAAQVPRHGAAG